MHQERTGLSPLVGVVLLFAIITGTVGLVAEVGLPMMQRMQDTGTIENQVTFLQGLDGQVRAVVGEGRYSTRTPVLRFSRGQYVIQPDRNRVAYRLRTDSPLVAKNTTARRGAVTLTADANATFGRGEGNKTVRAALRYTDVNLTGERRTLSPGGYRLRVRNGGLHNGTPMVAIVVP